MRIAEPALVGKQKYQGMMDPKQLSVPVERVRDPEGCPEVVYGPFCSAPGAICTTEEAVALADPKLLAFV